MHSADVTELTVHPAGRRVRWLIAIAGLLGGLWGTVAGAGDGEPSAGRSAGWIIHFAAGQESAAQALDAAAARVGHGGQGRWLSGQVAVVPKLGDAGRAAAARWVQADSPNAFAAPDAAETERSYWQSQPGVRLVEPDYLGEFAVLEAVAAPNDPSFADQGWLKSAGALQLWGLGRGQGTTVAVVDSGVDLSHPDLQANLLPGYDFADHDPDPQDELGHGTAVAGLVAAVCGNALGGCGMAPEAKFLPFKVSSSGDGARQQPSASAVVAAILRATEMQATVINLSLSFAQPTELLTSAIAEAQARGVLIVAAAGNGLAAPVAYPARLPGVIAVANCGTSGYLYLTSAFGPEVTVAAVGDKPFTTLLGGGAGSPGVGTSFAAPQVAGVLAALRSANPGWSKALLVQALQGTGKPVPGHGFRLLQAGAAAQWLLPAASVQRQAGGTGGGDVLSVDYTLPASDQPVDVYLSVTTPVGVFGLAPDGSWWSGWQNAAPWRRGYQGPRLEEKLFGAAARYPALSVADLPAGHYLWQVNVIDSARQRPLLPAALVATDL